MRFKISLALAALLPTLALAAPDPVKEIRAVLEAQAAAWNRGDLDGYMNGYARERDTEFASANESTRGWKTVRTRYRKKYRSRETRGHVSFPEVRITLLSSDAAVAVGHWKLQRQNEQPHGTFALLLRRRPEGWRIVRDYTAVARDSS